MKSYGDQLIVVTGGAGFIGSGVIRHLNDKGINNILVVDNLGHSEKWKNLVGKKFVDVIDKGVFFDWLQGKQDLIKAFIHLGACSSTVETNASYLLENNYHYSIRLAEYALKHQKRFIYASSAATYGDGSLGFMDDENALDALMPLNMYGFSKHLFDLWLKREDVLKNVVGLKFFNVFGPNEYHKGRMASMIMHVLPLVLKKEAIRLFKTSDPSRFADGEQKRDFIYVKDAVRVVCALLENDVMGLYNVGSGVASTWNQVANSVFKAANQPAKIEYIDMPPDLIGKYQNYTCADMHKMKNVLGELVTCMPIEESIADYVKNYLIPGKIW